MTKCRVVVVLMALVVAPLLLAACGSGTDTASFCTDAKKLATLNGTSKATLDKASDLYSQLADDASGSIKDDIELLSADEKKVAEGHISSVNEKQAEAASNRLTKYLTKTCGKAP